MADDDYHKKLGEMQKYVPFLETTIKRLKSEKDKPREAQISKLQSLLVILTDSKKKLKLDALKKCEEVILKLYDKVEKKPPVTMMHKYMCRTPPEEKSLNIENKASGFDPTFIVARQKLKQTETTPASPSPPLEQQINICKPVVIPTEKITPNLEPLAPLQNPQFNPPNWDNYQNIPQTLNWPVNAFNPDYPTNMNQVWQDPNSQNWTMPSNPNDPNWAQQDLYNQRIEPDCSNSKNDIWDRETLASKNYKHKKIDREIISYSDALSNSITSLESSPNFKPATSTAKIKIVGNNKEIIPIDTCPKKDKIKLDEKPKSVSRKSLPLPPAPQSRKSLEKEILPLNKPPLTDRDLQDLLSPVTESSSEGQSPVFNEDMDLDKLEELKAKLYKELQEQKPKHKKKSKEKDKIKSPPPVPVEKINPTPVASVNQVPVIKKPPTTTATTTTKVVERVIKEPSNVFGSLLSSIDEQIMGKSKDKKAEKKDTKKEEIKKVPVKETPKVKDKKETVKETSKALNIKDVASMNEKMKSIYFKSDDNKDKTKTESSSSKPRDSRDSSSSSKDERKTEKKKDESKKPKEEASKDKKSSKDAEHSKRRKSTDRQDKPKEEFKIPVVKPDEKPKEIVIPKEIDDKVFKTVEDIMKNLKESIQKPVADPLSKFGDLVKEKSDQLCDNKPVELPSSGRLSDKYPHKRKSIDSRASDSPSSDSNVPKIPQEPVQPVKLSDPRLRSTKVPNLVSPPIKELHFDPPQNRNVEINRHNDFDQRNFNKSNPEFSFQNSYNNMNNPNNFNRGNNNIFCNEPPQPVRPPMQQIPNEMHHVPFPQEDGFQNLGCRTPVDPFLLSGPRTPSDPFLNAGARTPADPFLNQNEQFINSGPPRTPGDPFLSPGNPPMMNPGRPPGPPDQFHNFNQFPPNEPMRNQFRNDFPMNRNQEPFNNPNHDRFNPNQNPNWNRPNQFPPVFNQPEPNQYDLSQMNPIDFYDNNPNNNSNRFEPEFGNPNSFRGRGNCNIRGNFGRGRGGPPDRDRNTFRDPRQFRNNGPPPLLVPKKFSPNEEPPHKEDNRRSRFDDVRDSRDSRDHRGDRDYRRSRFSKEDEHRSDRPRSSDDRYNRFTKREEPVRKPAFVREDPRRKSVDETVVEKPKEKDPPVVDKPVEKQPPVVVDAAKTKEEIQSPLDSLYSTETKRVGKGYGLQSFKIPKIKKVEEVKEDKDNKTTATATPEEINEDKVEETPKEEPVKENVKTKEEVVKPEEKSPEKKEEIKAEAGTSKPTELETKESPKTEADIKLDMFNNFMKHIFETCDSSVLFQYLDRCGFALPNAKTKRIRRIIDSDSSDTEDENRKEDSETDKPTPEPPAETPEPEELKTNEPEKIVETVSERIKNRRRKPVVYSSDSSPDKSQKKPGSTPEKETDDPNEETEKVTRISRSRTPKQTVKTQAKTRRKNALELLQEDIREMFISEGVLTATGKRMCRMMKEHQESGFISPNTDAETIKQPKDATESEEEIPLVKRKEKLKTTKQEKSPEIVASRRATRKSPRVILEKIEISAKAEAATDHSDKESGPEDETPEMKKPSVPVRRTRRSNTVSGEFLELDENGVVVKVQDKKKKAKLNKFTTDETDGTLDTSFEDDGSVKSESNLVAASKKEETPVVAAAAAGEAAAEEPKPNVPVIKKKKIRRRGRGGWATGVIKNKRKKVKSLEKNPDSPALTVSTEDHHEADDHPESGGSDEEGPKNNSEAYDDEYSLLKVDINEDVNYYLDNGNKFNCKLCDYKGKLIVHHYRSKHPESENMISRLSPEQASAAKIESNEFNFVEIIPYEEATKGKKRRTTFTCRFCLLTFKQEFTCSFFDHICCHTGEYRYKCERCTFSTGVKKTLSTHCHSLHPDMEKPLVIKPIYEGPPNFRLVFGYLCSACNFTQLLKPNVEKHIRVSHPDQDITIIKISMSTKPIPLTDLKKPEEEQAAAFEATETETESPKPKEQEVPKTPKKSQKAKPEPVEHHSEPEVEPEVEPEPEAEAAAPKEREPNLTVFMVPEEISQQEKLIDSERLKKMEEIQSNVVPRRPKLQFVDKLKNKLDSVESEIALLESMEAENAALEAEAVAAAAAAAAAMETEAEAAAQVTPAAQINDKPEEGWISIASTCSLANAEQLFDDEPSKDQAELEQNDADTEPENDENLNETNSFDDLENETLNSLNLSPSTLSQNTKKTGFLDTIQRLAAQLQNNKAASLSDCEDGERLYYSPEVTPENSPKRNAELESTEPIGEAFTLNAGSIEIQLFGNKNVYSCLIPDCYYSSSLKTNFRKHLMDEHKNLRVNCGLCINECDYLEWDLCGLFLHMLDQHKPTTPVKKKPLQIKEEPVEPPEIPIKTEIFSPEKQPDMLQAGSIRLRRISGDILSSFSAENSIEYPTISIPENVVSEPNVNQMLGQQEEHPYAQQEVEPPNEPGFLQISNVRTLTPEEENHLQIKTATPPPTTPAKEPPKAFKKIIPKAYILNMGDLKTSGVTKIVNNAGSSINLTRATNKEGTMYNLTLKPKSSEANPTLLTINSEKKPTKTIIFRKTAPFLPTESGGIPVPKLTLLKSPKTTLTKGFLAATMAKLNNNTAKKFTFVTPSTGLKGTTPTPTLIKGASAVVKTTAFKLPAATATLISEGQPQQSAKQFQQPLRLNKSEFILTIMTEYPKIMDFYKCPCIECIFTTNDRVIFQEHFATHARILPGKYCVYCLSTVSPKELTDHLERKHGNCMYQCALCFYRACCDMYIAVHQSFCHQLEIPKFYTVQTNPSLGAIVGGLDDGLLPRPEAILPYYCTLDACNRTFYTMNDFRVHMKIFHKRNNVCSICKFELNNAELLVGHYVTHNIANFQCRYCKFGSEKPQIMLKHYAIEHYNKNPIVYKREYKSGTTSAHSDEVARLEDIVEVNLSYLVKSTRSAPQQPLETQNHIPAAASSTSDDETNEADDIPCSESTETTIKDTSDELLIDPKTGELIPPPEKQTKPDDGFREPEITLKHRNEQSLKAIVDAVDPLNLDEASQSQTAETEQNDETETENENEEYYEDSGLSGCELYVCGTSDCSAKLPNLKEFKDHMYSCDVLTHDVGWYTCFHCKKRFKYVGALIKHLTVHGPQKYTCSLCPAKAHLETLIIKHMKVQHKIPLAKLVPVDKSNPDSDLMAVGIKPRTNKQKSKKDDELYEKELQDAIKHTKEQIELIQNDSNKTSTSPTTSPITSPIPTVTVTKAPVIKYDDKNAFGPEDIDKLPRPPIFAQEIKCKICSYCTKVRSNMLKHLKAHIDNKPVAETAPVNPVPCLEKNELMFDKMTNLAASSHTGGRMGAKNKEDKVKDKAPVLQNYPGFIAASKRFVCGSNGCNYLTHGDSMLRHHLTALHIDEASYKCPHCQLDLAPDGLNVLAVDNILFHLKMHDLHLYKCNECQFYHYQKHKMERHLSDQHLTTSKSTFTTIRELDSSANLEDMIVRGASTPSSPEKSVDGEDAATHYPWRCGFCDYKSTARGSIQSHAASVHKIRSQFKCGSCEFRCSAKNNYQTHFKNKHPNEKVVILSVYYKVTEEATSSALSSSDAETVHNKSFDTTPLWTKNRTGVKHIRGILLDDAPVAKRPKIIEKLAANAADADEDKLKRSPQKSAETGHNLRFPATYGTNRNQYYLCPTCNAYETKNAKQFVVHLYKEINYFRYMCNFCAHKSTHMTEAQKHYKELHSNENVVSNKQICTVLRYYSKAEKWVEKCLQVQQEGIFKYETERIKQEAANSSTETLLLEIDEDARDANEEEQTSEMEMENEGEETPEKPQLTPQQHRRSSRVSSKPNLNLNESFESNDSRTDELPPPVLELQIPDAKSPKKGSGLYKCEHCSFVAKAPASLQKHVKKHFETKPYKCSLCKYMGSQLAHLQSHFYFKHTSQPLQYTLEPCPEVAQCRPLKRKRAASALDEPIIEEGVIKAEPQQTKEIIEAPPLTKIKSELTQTNTNTSTITNTNTNDLVNNFYICFHCPRRSPSLNLIREHFSEAHEKTYRNLFKYKKLTIDKPKKTKYSCQYCEWMGHPDGLKQHHLQKHIDKEYICVKDILLKCELCTEVFNKMGLLKKHFSRNHPNHNLFYQSSTKENDDEYIETVEVIEEVLEIKTETTAKEINCTYCVLSFADVSALRAHHDLVHNHLDFNEIEPVDELKKYKCPQCEHTSNSFPAMRDHLRNHNKPYKCGHCDMAASYPNILKTHHMKEHRNLEPSVLIINEAQKRNEELRDNLMHLVNGEYVRLKDNLKRQHSDAGGADEPPKKLLLLEDDQKEKRAKPKQRRKSIAAPVKREIEDADDLLKSPIKKLNNVARKSTATPPRVQNVAKKSTTPRPYVNLAFSYYGTKPLKFEEIKNIRTELPIMGKNVPLNIGSMSQILQLFPVVVVDDIDKTNI